MLGTSAPWTRGSGERPIEIASRSYSSSSVITNQSATRVVSSCSPHAAASQSARSAASSGRRMSQIYGRRMDQVRPAARDPELRRVLLPKPSEDPQEHHAVMGLGSGGISYNEQSSQNEPGGR